MNTAIDTYLREAGLMDLRELDPTIGTDIRYATTSNFTGRVLYPEPFGLFLEPELAQRVVAAHAMLKKVMPGHRFVVFDTVRPISVQYRMFDLVRGTDAEPYIAYPSGEHPGGFHNYGMAIDLSIAGPDGCLLDMGTDFDSFAPEAHAGDERRLLAEGRISPQAYTNRMLLYWLMGSQQLLPYPYEWWHYQFYWEETDKKRFKLIDF